MERKQEIKALTCSDCQCVSSPSTVTKQPRAAYVAAQTQINLDAWKHQRAQDSSLPFKKKEKTPAERTPPTRVGGLVTDFSGGQYSVWNKMGGSRGHGSMYLSCYDDKMAQPPLCHHPPQTPPLNLPLYQLHPPQDTTEV